MPKLIGSPTHLPATGAHPQHVDEYVGLVNTGDTHVSVSHAVCPAGWQSPVACPAFDEFVVVLKGALQIEYTGGSLQANAGQAIHARRDEWVRYSAPKEGGVEYISVCVPAFSPAKTRADF